MCQYERSTGHQALFRLALRFRRGQDSLLMVLSPIQVQSPLAPWNLISNWSGENLLLIIICRVHSPT